jgi:hypothetical protein
MGKDPIASAQRLTTSDAPAKVQEHGRSLTNNSRAQNNH